MGNKGKGRPAGFPIDKMTFFDYILCNTKIVWKKAY